MTQTMEHFQSSVQRSFMKLFRFIYSSAYFFLLSYIVLFAARRRNAHYNYQINFIPIKNTIHTFFTLNINDKNEIHNFYVNLFGNILLFVPFSIILITVFKIKNLKLVILWAMLLSTCIEITQYVFQVGYADIDDVMLNVAGALLGFFLYKLFLQLNFFSLLKQAN